MESELATRALAEKPKNRLPEDESEEDEVDRWFYDDRWLFNGTVFFLLFPFTIFVSFAGGSLIPVGFGVALVEWRIAATPEIVNRIASNMNSRLRGFLRNLAISLVPGLILPDVSDYVANAGNHFSTSIGFPLSYAHILPSFCGPGPSCLYTFNPLNIILDYLFWTLLALVIIASITRVVTLLKNGIHLPGKI